MTRRIGQELWQIIEFWQQSRAKILIWLSLFINIWWKPMQSSEGRSEDGRGNLSKDSQYSNLSWCECCLDRSYRPNRFPGQTWERHWNLQSLELALVSTKGPILFHDNVQPHVSQPTLEKLNELGYEVLPHLLHSSNLSPTDSLL